MQSKPRYSISDVSQKTGVAAITLRAWERRYGLVKPQRSAKGHRLYTEDNVTEIQQIVMWLNRGVAISKVPALLAKNALARPSAEPIEDDQAQEWHGHQTQLVSAIIELNQRQADQLCDKMNKTMPFNLLINSVYQPVLTTLQQRWHQKIIGFELEHQVWQQLWQRQTTLMTLRAEKQKAWAKAWLINRDTAHNTSDFWMLYALLIQSGIRLNTISMNGDLSGLSRVKHDAKVPLIIFGHQRLSSSDKQMLNQLAQSSDQNVICLGSMVEIDHAFFDERSDLLDSKILPTPTDFSQLTTWLKEIN